MRRKSRVCVPGLTGYIDRLGTREHNARLSQARAETVKAWLVEQGIAATVKQTEGRGSGASVVMCQEQALPGLTTCLQPNRRVEVDLASAVTR